MSDSGRIRFDVLAARPLRRLWRWPGFPLALQAIALVAVVLLAINGWNVGHEQTAKELLTLRKTNLTTLVVWGLWWPGMIAVVLLFGRIWCAVCPMELVHRAADAVARRIGWPRARLGAFLRAGWMTLLAYLLLQVLVAGISLHRFPHYTSLLLVALFGAALVSGLVFRHPRAFCAGFCPASALLSVYGRFTPLKLDVRDPAVCEGCEGKDCADPARRHGLDGRSCPSLITPWQHRQSDGCLVCLQCAKACPEDNVGFGAVDPEAGSRRHRLLQPFEAAFVLIAAGFAAHEVLTEVKWLDRYFHYVPERLQSLAPSVPFGWWEAAWFLVLFPILLWALVAAAGYLAGHRAGLRSLLLAAATGAAPVVAVAPASKGIAKLASWGGYLPLALAEPRGQGHFRELAEGTLAAPARLTGLSLLGILMMAALLWVSWRAWQWAKVAAQDTLPAARAGLAVPAVFYAGVLAVWCWT